jgi:transposase
VEVAIGVDPSKSSLAVAAVDPLGRVVGTAEFSNDSRGHRALLRWARERGPDRVIGIECSLSFGATLSRLLLQSGEDVREVPTTLTHQQRRRRASQGKSDLVDSVAIARIVASGEVLPSAHRLEVLTDLRALVEYRDQLVRARTQVANRTHADLMNVLPGYERRVPNLRAKAHRTTARSLLRGDRSVRAELGRKRLDELSRLDREIAAMDPRIEATVRKTETSLTSIPGVGPFIAAKILGEVGDPSRVRSKPDLRRVLRHGSAVRLLGAGPTTSAEPRREPSAELGLALHRPSAVPDHAGSSSLHGSAAGSRQVPQGGHALSEAAPFERGLPSPRRRREEGGDCEVVVFLASGTVSALSFPSDVD